jgi:hypothetical protein
MYVHERYKATNATNINLVRGPSAELSKAFRSACQISRLAVVQIPCRPRCRVDERRYAPKSNLSAVSVVNGMQCTLEPFSRTSTVVIEEIFQVGAWCSAAGESVVALRLRVVGCRSVTLARRTQIRVTRCGIQV